MNNEKSIEIFFKKIITPEIVNLIAKYTNKKIDLIDNRNLKNDEYKLKRDRLIEIEVSSQEFYVFIGLLILLGITKKSNESITLCIFCSRNFVERSISATIEIHYFR